MGKSTILLGGSVHTTQPAFLDAPRVGLRPVRDLVFSLAIMVHQASYSLVLPHDFEPELPTQGTSCAVVLTLQFL